MTSDTKRSGLSLLAVGVLGILFFWATDPHFGVVSSRSATPVDAVQDARLGTWVGVGVSGIVLLVGGWLLMKRST